MPDLPRLRPYQARILRAVLRSAFAGDGLTFTVIVARQGGKNELSAQLELARLIADAHTGGESIKTAPTFEPQCQISLRRLWTCLNQTGLETQRQTVKPDGDNGVRVGRAVQRFLSCEPEASVVGATCSRLLECDEAQDIDQAKFDKDFRPMAATTNATTVYYGTAWEETSLLAQMRDSNAELERRDGITRNFAITWEEVARYNPAYATYVAAERDRLGEDHPLFKTQYLLKTLPGSGRLLPPAALALLGSGTHPPQRGPAEHEPHGISYVGGLDVGGEASASGRDPDSSVLAIGRVSHPISLTVAQEPIVDLVALYAWQGTPQAELVRALLPLVRDLWRLQALTIDVGGVGEGVGSALATASGMAEDRLHRLRLTEQLKSSLGYGLQAATASGRLRLFANDGSTERNLALEQAKLARAIYKPNKLLHWHVDEADGHDDYLMALALCVEAASSTTPRAAHGRRGEWEDDSAE